jgi:copper chaperone NosL
MFAYAAEHPDLHVRHWYVHDFESEAWIDAELATYVRSQEFATPMGHGLVALADADAAASLAASVNGSAEAFKAIRFQPNPPTETTHE